MPEKALSIAALTRADLDSLVTLHGRIVAGLDNSAYLHTRERDFFADLLRGGGRVAGVRSGDRLVGYAALRFPGGRINSYSRQAGIPDRKLKRIAEGAGMGIDAALRGSGIFGALVDARLALARDAACDWFCGLVWRYNFVNLAPHLRRGYFGVDLVRDIDGANFLLVRPVSGWRRRQQAPALRYSVHDRRGLHAAFARGYMITACRQNGPASHFIMSPADPRLAELR